MMTDSMSRTSRLRLMLVLLVSLVACDQASKQYAIKHWSHLEDQRPQSYLGDVFRITFAKNEGAFLSLFGNLSESARYAILVVGNAVGMTVLASLLLLSPKWDRWSFVAWTLVVAGGIGNLIDRLRFLAVIDFLNLGIGPVRTGIFNVADMAITAGFFMIVPQLFRSAPGQTVSPLVPAATTMGTPASGTPA